jgi:hypothetical protein
MTLGENKVESVRAILEKLKNYVTVHGGRLGDAEALKIVCSLQGSEETMRSMYEKEFAAEEPPAKMSIDQVMARTKAEANKLHMKAVIDCVLPQLAKRASESCRHPDDGREGAVSNISISVAEPAVAITTVEVGVVGTATALLDDSLSS